MQYLPVTTNKSNIKVIRVNCDFPIELVLLLLLSSICAAEEERDWKSYSSDMDGGYLQKVPYLPSIFPVTIIVVQRVCRNIVIIVIIIIDGTYLN